MAIELSMRKAIGGLEKKGGSDRMMGGSLFGAL